eukprot:gene4678-5125_t
MIKVLWLVLGNEWTMSKWHLLKTALKEGRSVSHCESIHARTEQFAFRLDGVLSRKKVIWEGFLLEAVLREDADLLSLPSQCRSFINLIDCAEVELRLSLEEVVSSSEDEVVAGLTAAGLAVTVLASPTATDGRRKLFLRVVDPSYQPLLPLCDFVAYQSPLLAMPLLCREAPAARRITASDLLSDRLFGVDNTGNICVWPCETLLLALFLMLGQPSGPVLTPEASALLSLPSSGGRVLEVGCGMAGLAGRGIAEAWPSLQVVLSDGHPSCAANLRVCLAMDTSAAARRASLSAVKDEPVPRVSCEHLPWAEADRLPAEDFDLVIGADCLFFEDCQESLLKLLKRLLKRTGRAVFLQPARGKSLDLFEARARELFHVSRCEDYVARLSEQRRDYLPLVSEGYRDDLCYPILLVLSHKS